MDEGRKKEGVGRARRKRRREKGRKQGREKRFQKRTLGANFSSAGGNDETDILCPQILRYDRNEAVVDHKSSRHGCNGNTTEIYPAVINSRSLFQCGISYFFRLKTSTFIRNNASSPFLFFSLLFFGPFFSFSFFLHFLSFFLFFYCSIKQRIFRIIFRASENFYF